jgi:hypothetical protein
MFKPWYPPTAAELDGIDADEYDMDTVKENMDYFLDAIVDLLPPGKSRDDLRGVYMEVDGNRVVAFFLPSDNVFQEILGKKIYREYGGENWSIKQ